MVDLLKSASGTLTFLLGYFVLLISLYIIPILAGFLGNTLSGIIWFGTIIIWILCMLVIPVGLMLWGITTKADEPNPVFLMTIGVLWFIFASAFTYFSYYMTDTLTAMLTTSINGVTYTLPVVLFWIGLVAIWIFNIGVIPTSLILEAKQGQ